MIWGVEWEGEEVDEWAGWDPDDPVCNHEGDGALEKRTALEGCSEVGEGEVFLDEEVAEDELRNG